MDWILEHLQLVLAGAGALAWWLTQRRETKTAAQDQPPPTERTLEDGGLAERTRRIREEIQRKIEERTRDPAQRFPRQREPGRDAPAGPPSMVREAARQIEPPPLYRQPPTRLEVQRTAEILEQQAELAEQLRQAGEMKAAALRRARFEEELARTGQAASQAQAALTKELHDPAALRRAFLLREIIGPPVALRQ